MCRTFSEWQSEIKDYCIKNNLSFDKAKNMYKSYNNEFLALQYHDESHNSGLGLLDETPMPVVLAIHKIGSELIFEQTEYTQRYLAQ